MKPSEIAGALVGAATCIRHDDSQQARTFVSEIVTGSDVDAALEVAAGLLAAIASAFNLSDKDLQDFALLTQQE
jgi:hypothetical protein